jgi:hypothetical protein
VRDGKGRWVRTIHTVQRDADAAELRANGLTYQQIADELGYCHKREAWRAVERAKADVIREPAERLIAVEAALLDGLYVSALEVLERDHYAHANGRIVKDDAGAPLLDDGPKLAAIRELRQIRESFRKLHGLDAEKKVNLSGSVRYEVVGVDPEDLK